MKRIRNVFAITLLIVVCGVVALAKAAVGMESRVNNLVANFIESVSKANRIARPSATSERVMVQTTNEQTAYLNLYADSTAIPTEYASGTGIKNLAGSTRAHALASADFDEDGVPDLVAGYADASGEGVITLQRGNVDAIYPNSFDARERSGRGEFSEAAFHREASAFRVQEAAHFIGAGDFDADGHWDVVAARRGGQVLYFLRGDGWGNLAEAGRVEVAGAVTSFATGEINRRDGLTDIVVGVEGGDAGASIIVYESFMGALRAQPEAHLLPAVASGMALGALDANLSINSLAIAAGSELIVVHGRDRRLSLDAESRANVPKAIINRYGFEFRLAAVSIGDYAGDELSDVAVLSGNSVVQVLTQIDGVERVQRKSSREESTEKGKLELSNVEVATDGIKWQRSERASVRLPELQATKTVSAGEATARLLMTAKLSSLAKDDLLVMGGGHAYVVTNEAAKVDTDIKAQEGGTESFGLAELRVSASIGTESEVAAVLPMRLNPSALSSFVILGADSKAPSVVSPQAAVTFTVNSTADTDDANPGNGECRDADANCTLRAALSELNSNTNAGPFTINFQIPGTGVPTISTNGFFVNSNTIFKPVVIDGTTQTAGRVQIKDTVGHGGLLRIAGGNSTVRGLVMSDSSQSIRLIVNGNNIIEGNYFGTNADGTAADTRRGDNDTGIYVETSNNRIGGTTPAARNVTSGSRFGIHIAAGSGNLIQGNYIGTNAAGAAAIGNELSGIFTVGTGTTIGGTTSGAGNLISGNQSADGRGALDVRNGGAGIAFVTVQGNLFGTDASGNSRIGNDGDALSVSSSGGGVTTIGGTTPAARNIISGSNGRGIYINVCCDPNFNPSAYIQGNYIGTNPDGTVAIPNLGHGISLDRANITVGGAVSGAGNLISGNGGDGINVSGFFGSPNHTIQGNLIGTDVSGTLAIPNQGDGIEAFRADNTLIGGTTPEARNTISGNLENGILFRGVDNINTGRIRVQGNYIGTNRFGTGALGNRFDGIFFSGNVSGGDIGGTAPGAGNVIAHNSGGGIVSNRDLLGGAVLSNSIHSNGELGIDKNENGVSPTLNNSETNSPVLTSVANTDTSTVITGTTYNFGNLTPFIIQFFSNPACDASGHGEGQTLIGETTVPAPTQFTTINFSHNISPAVPGGTIITAVAIRRPYAHNQNFGDRSNDSYSSEFSNCASLAAPMPTPTPTPTPLQVFVIAPNRGGDAAVVTRQITGQGFQTGATAKLTLAGQSDIVGSNITITNNGTTLTATFDLRGKERGVYSVVVTNPEGASATLADAFTIAEPRRVSTWIKVIGRYTVRGNREQTFYITYGNSGDVDAGLSVMSVVIPNILTVTQLPRLEDGRVASLRVGESVSTIEFFVPKIAAQSSISLPMKLTTPDAAAHSTVEISYAGLNVISREQTIQSGQGANRKQAGDVSGQGGFGEQDIPGCQRGGDPIQEISGRRHCFAQCTNPPAPGPDDPTREELDALYEYSRRGLEEEARCRNRLDIVFSQDPNEKTSDQGAGTPRYVVGAIPLPYSVFFENKSDATAPAQDVVITDQLDVSKFDLSTFQLGAIAFGKDTIVTPPAGLSQWSTNVDLRPANNLIVRINAGLNPQTGIVQWTFTSLDPATMLPTEDALAGFLPPNRTAPEGEGSVLFSVLPRQNLTTGTEIRNGARIVFDTNAAIDTPVWLNTIDNTPPESRILSAVRRRNSSRYELRFSGTDIGAGVSNYTIFVSENGAPFTVFSNNTTATPRFFTGRAGSTYRFYSIAGDGAGNRESAPQTADVTIVVPKRRVFTRSSS